ncbi:MBL fold metallo-hydrolase [Pelagicoccus sp. SDUM812005]|uniref:MBL fold metallo-hydrolase n=1 Tax=Pelagicoccus sp. SDUM812005 TaxID=3041257 RepID=UPI00280F8390|nr:MBL fold metallo-hydrolase [Pelagicoccus sp. SDUM812005]MDQ8181063.1 MBL fold metallo-hydrolase [Pelagicoccus sp. SDUM812005]
MALIVEPIYSGGIAQLSYLIGDDSEGVAAVIDPRPDCDVYMELARSKGLAIRDIFETHIHADFMSGARELASRLGGAVPIRVSGEGGASYGFGVEKISDKDEFQLGEMRIQVRHTPGHTPEHVSFLVFEGDDESPFAVFSGDTLFVDSVGRPDLLGEDETEELAEQLYQSIHGFYKELPDGVLLYPGHGAGSACGPDIGNRMFSTIGFEKEHNAYFACESKEDFVKKVLDAAPEEPRHYRPMKKLNSEGPPIMGGYPPAEAMTVEAFSSACENKGNVILDTRSPLAFGSGHIAGSLNIELRGEMSVWSGWMLEFNDPIYLVLERDEDLETALSHLWRTGHTNVIGYLAGGLEAWLLDGKKVDQVEIIDVHRLHDLVGEIQILDVRSESERKGGFVPESEHLFVPKVREEAASLLDKKRPVATYCASGSRASVAASVLKQEGFESVMTVPGSWSAWTEAGFEVAKNERRLASV